MLNNKTVTKIQNKKVRKANKFDSDQTFKIERKLKRQQKSFNKYQCL